MLSPSQVLRIPGSPCSPSLTSLDSAALWQAQSHRKVLLGSTCPGGRSSKPWTIQPQRAGASDVSPQLPWGGWAVWSLLAPQDRKGSQHWGGGSLAPREGQAGSGLQGGKQPWLLGSGRKDVLLTRTRFLAKKGKADKNILKNSTGRVPCARTEERLGPSGLKSPMLSLPSMLQHPWGAE